MCGQSGPDGRTVHHTTEKRPKTCFVSGGAYCCRADGPAQVGGRSAPLTQSCPETFFVSGGKESWSADGPPMGCGRSAIGPRTVRLSASRALADGPPVDRGQSARGLLHGSLCAQVDSPVMDRGRSAHVQKGGVSQYLTYIGVSLSSFHQIRPHPLFLSSLSLSSMWWELSRSRSFGVIPGRSEHIPGHSVTFFNMFSRYFVKSLTLVLGFHN